MKHLPRTQIIFCAFLLGILTISRAQESPQQGYIIKSDGTKEIGWIYKVNGDARFNSVHFASRSFKKKIRYTFDEVTEYGIGDFEKYVSVLNFPESITPEIDSSFLQVLSAGKLSLLQGKGPRFILLDSTNILHPLRNVELGVRDVRGLDKEIYEEERRVNTGIMVQLMSNCLPLAIEISNGDNQFEQNGRLLADIVRDYNECQASPNIDYLSKRKKFAFAAHAGIGLSMNKPWFQRSGKFIPVEGGPYANNYNYEYSPSISLSYGAEFWLPFVYDQVSIIFQSSYTKYSFGGSYYGPVYKGSVDSVSSYLDLEYKALDISLGLKQSILPMSRFAPYVLFGGIFRQNMELNSDFHSVRFNTNKPTISNQRLSVVNKTGLFWGLGTTLPLDKKLPFRMSLEYKGSITGIPYRQSSVQIFTENFREHGVYLVVSSKPF